MLSNFNNTQVITSPTSLTSSFPHLFIPSFLIVLIPLPSFPHLPPHFSYLTVILHLQLPLSHISSSSSFLIVLIPLPSFPHLPPHSSYLKVILHLQLPLSHISSFSSFLIVLIPLPSFLHLPPHSSYLKVILHPQLPLSHISSFSSFLIVLIPLPSFPHLPPHSSSLTVILHLQLPLSYTSSSSLFLLPHIPHSFSFFPSSSCSPLLLPSRIPPPHSLTSHLPHYHHPQLLLLTPPPRAFSLYSPRSLFITSSRSSFYFSQLLTPRRGQRNLIDGTTDEQTNEGRERTIYIYLGRLDQQIITDNNKRRKLVSADS